MRVVSWNLGAAFGFRETHARALHYLGALDPDLAMLQEVLPDLPEWVLDRWTVVRRQPRLSGSLILAKPELELWDLPGEHPSFKGSDAYLATGTVTLPDGTSLLVGTVHTPIGKATDDELFGYDPEEIRRPRDVGPKGDIGPRRNDVAYAYFRVTVLGHRFLVSGDWNIARLWDYQYRRPPTHEVDFFNRAEADGWMECYRLRHDEGEGQSLFKDQGPRYQEDHAFCDRQTAKALRACRFLAHPAQDLKLSDHAPLVMEFEP